MRDVCAAAAPSLHGSHGERCAFFSHAVMERASENAACSDAAGRGDGGARSGALLVAALLMYICFRCGRRRERAATDAPPSPPPAALLGATNDFLAAVVTVVEAMEAEMVAVVKAAVFLFAKQQRQRGRTPHLR